MIASFASPIGSPAGNASLDLYYDLLSSIIIRINPVSVAPTAHHNVIVVRKIIDICVGSELFLIISETLPASLTTLKAAAVAPRPAPVNV
jgi:hypothetical protein